MEDMLSRDCKELDFACEDFDCRVFFVTTVVDAFDYQKSKYRPTPDGNISIFLDELHLLPEKVGDANLFYVQGIRRGPYVSQAFVDRVTSHGFKGLVFERAYPPITSEEKRAAAVDDYLKKRGGKRSRR